MQFMLRMLALFDKRRTSVQTIVTLKTNKTTLFWDVYSTRYGHRLPGSPWHNREAGNYTGPQRQLILIVVSASYYFNWSQFVRLPRRWKTPDGSSYIEIWGRYSETLTCWNKLFYSSCCLSIYLKCTINNDEFPNQHSIIICLFSKKSLV